MARRKPKETLLSLGAKLMAIGAALLLMPLLMGGSALLSQVAPALRTPGWVALTLGALLAGAQLLMRKRPAPAQKAADTVPGARHRRRPRRRARLAETPAQVEPTLAPEPGLAPPREQAPPAPALVAAPEHPSGWSPEVFAAIEWRRFEAVVEQLFAQAGFETRAQSHGADGGVDIWLHSRHADGPVAVVQCKHWQGKPVPVSAMRQFFGVMASHGIARGTYATTSRFTPEALAFAQANGINAQDGDGLLKLIAARTPEQQAALLTTALAGEYWRPTCPSCGDKMLERTAGSQARNAGELFWGCSNFPRCRYNQPMTHAAKARVVASGVEA